MHNDTQELERVLAACLARGMEVEIVTLLGGDRMVTHPKSKCQGQACCIHNPSKHHMRTWKQRWNYIAWKTERICPHGFAHPDPDHLAAVQGKKREMDSSHECDGCCKG